MIKQLVSNAEKQHRALKLRIYPTNEQEILINKTFGCCRQIYNNRLFERNQFYETVIKPETDKKIGNQTCWVNGKQVNNEKYYRVCEDSERFWNEHPTYVDL